MWYSLWAGIKAMHAAAFLPRSVVLTRRQVGNSSIFTKKKEKQTTKCLFKMRRDHGQHRHLEDGPPSKNRAGGGPPGAVALLETRMCSRDVWESPAVLLIQPDVGFCFWLHATRHRRDFPHRAQRKTAKPLRVRACVFCPLNAAHVESAVWMLCNINNWCSWGVVIKLVNYAGKITCNYVTGGYV